jgi:chromosome segregation ATPase
MEAENWELKANEEKQKRQQLEEEFSKVQEIVRNLENALSEKSEELEMVKKECENKIYGLYMKIGNLEAQHLNDVTEVENLRMSINSIKADYYRATDNSISSSSKVDEMYATLAGYRNEINSLRMQVTEYQEDRQRLEEENARLLKITDKRKSSKFSQTDYSAFTPISSMEIAGTRNKLAESIGARSELSKSGSQSMKALPVDYSLHKIKTQMRALQSSKDRIELQMKVLSNYMA